MTADVIDLNDRRNHARTPDGWIKLCGYTNLATGERGNWVAVSPDVWPIIANQYRLLRRLRRFMPPDRFEPLLSAADARYVVWSIVYAATLDAPRFLGEDR